MGQYLFYQEHDTGFASNNQRCLHQPRGSARMPPQVVEAPRIPYTDSRHFIGARVAEWQTLRT